MRARHLIATIAGAAAIAAIVPATAPAEGPLVGVVGHMTCIAPTDAAGIDAMLNRAGSPLAGEGATFVTEGAAAGIDPRALVAIAAHETLLETYGPAREINNPFGLGPGITFASERDAIVRAARTLAAYYLPEGRTTFATIGAKWAPLGAANDPSGLNANWTTGAGAYFAALGGDPERTVLLADQDAAPTCAPSVLTGAPAVATADGPSVVTAWGGAPPAATSTAARDGADPGTGQPAVLAGFVFPLALPAGAPAVFRDQFSEPGAGPCATGDGRQCALTIAASGAHAVASVSGTLRGATVAEREEGLAFWIQTADGDRVGYGPLVSYASGVGEGAAVAAGSPLGAAPASLRVAWERDGERINPYHLLQATRPSGS